MFTGGRDYRAFLIASGFFLMLVFAPGAVAPKLWADDAGTGAKIPLEIAKMIIEFNSTAEDVGVQVLLDAEPWKSISIVAPNGANLFEVQNRGKLRRLGLTELFYESEEPSLDDLPLSEFLALFPEGKYKFFGTTVEGDRLTGIAEFTHNIPDGPSFISPKKKDVLDPGKVVIRWEPVTSPLGIVIVGYQVIVEGDNPLRTFSIDLPATETSVAVPRNFLESGKRYKVEILAKEVGGNQTISERAFRTR